MDKLKNQINFSSDIAMLLRRIPSREELTSAAALTFVAKPKECEVDFPFGSIISSAPASSDDEEPEQPPKRRRSDNPDNAEPGTSEKLSTSKYNPSVFSNMRGKFPNNIKFLLPKNMNTNFWKKKVTEDMSEYLSEEILEMHTPLQSKYSIVKQAGNLDTVAFLNATTQYLKTKESYLQEVFNHDELKTRMIKCSPLMNGRSRDE